MPVSVVCESSANVNAALRESLGQSCSTAAACGDDAGSSDDCIQNKLVASAKRVLLSKKIDYEEVNDYGQSVLNSLKSKYLLLNPSISGNGHNNNNTENVANGSNNNNNRNGQSADGTNGSSTQNTKRTINSSPTELPQPKQILYPRENVRVGWKSAHRKWQVGVGMMNVGNTCYLNSTLQALFHVPSMAQWLVSDSVHLENCDLNTDSGCIICAMAKTLQASQSGQSAIRPYFVYSKLKSICKNMVMGRQEDAHEFLRYLVEAMEKSYVSRFRNFKDLDQYTKETTPLNQILGGYLKSAVRCLACGHVSVTFQHFQDLLLDIRKSDTVDEALEGYFSRERLEDMGYRCEACKKKVSATKQFSLERAPIALCIQLKRFSMLGNKLNKQIAIKPRLDLTKFASRKCNSNSEGHQLTYRLVSMVTHLGASQNCGHYTAIGLTESGTYYNYDDSYVRPISVQNVCNTNAYIIFYEMEIAPPRQLPHTQVSGCENYAKVNGHIDSQRDIIGPQLPPSGLSSYTTTAPLGAIKTNLSNGSSFSNNKVGNNKHSSGSNNNNNNGSSKIMIHFKNNNGNASVKAVTSSTTIVTATATSTSQNDNNKLLTHNGLHSGTGKFQEFAHAKSALVSPSNKGQTTATTNGNESSSSYTDDEVTSSGIRNNTNFTPRSVKTQVALPNMPLFESPTTTRHPTRSPLVAPVKSALKSLVPYETEESDDDDGEYKRGKGTVTTEQSQNAKTAQKRCNSAGSSSHGSSDGEDDNAAPTKIRNGIKVKRGANTTPSNLNALHSNGTYSQSKSRQKTDAIDDIFNLNKRSTNSNTNNKNNQHHPNSQTRSNKHKSTHSQFAVSSTTATTDSDNEGDQRNVSNNSHNFKRSNSTPPSPPVIKSKTGLWQVTPLNSNNITLKSQLSEPALKTQISPLKNPKNPFACKTPSAPELFNKRSKFNDKPRACTFSGNGYQRDDAGDSAVTQLLKQSHRGYGAPVLTWNGEQPEIEKEVIAEAREQRQREWQDEEDTEMDRGRQKKTKAFNSNQQELRTPGYNPFQEQQDSQRHRLKHGVSHVRAHIGHFRHQFQRNKFKFPRFNSKFQHRLQHRNNNGSSGGYSNRRNS